MLVRDLTRGRIRPLLDSLILIVVPIFNADGNDHVGPGDRNRPGQNGPSIVGQNTNGQGLNINRDYVKLEAPETRAAVQLIKVWDPDVLIDLHTTNGSYHGYVLTYSPGLNPNTNPAADYVRGRLLPAVRDRMQRRHRQQTFPYGNFRNQDPDSLMLGWETYDARPRFGTNWMGLRGRMGILSEGYSNADLKTRILATYNFVHEVLSFIAEHRVTIKSLVLASDAQRSDSIAVRSTLARPTQEVVVAEVTRSAGEGNGGYAKRQRTGVYRSIRMPVFGSFQALRSEAVPEVYLVPPRLRNIVDLLRAQGVAVDSLSGGARMTYQEFRVDSVTTGPLFEGHRTVQVEGAWSSAASDTLVRPGWYQVRTRQPLGVFAAYLLEPASEDGVVTWNFLDRELQPHTPYPIVRAASAPGVRAIAVP